MRNSLVSSLLAASATLTLAGSAHAVPQLLYYQDWQEANLTNDWTSTNTASCNTYAPPAPVDLRTAEDPAECTGRYASETIRWSGGRVMAKRGVAVQSGDDLCVTAWVRAKGAGPNRAQPFVGLNYINVATGFPDAYGAIGGCRHGEHYLIGVGFNDDDYRNNGACPGGGSECCNGRSTTGYGPVAEIANDEQWHFYSKSFEVHPTDVANGNSFLTLKLQNFSGNGSCAPGVVAPAADFDDIRIWKLEAGDVCPTQAETQVAGDDAHTTCAGTAPFCVSSPVDYNVIINGQPVAKSAPQLSCTGCTESFGGASATACAAAAPACGVDGACAPCNGDAHAGSTHQCGAQHPFCKPDFSCGECVDDGDCGAVNGVTRAGDRCVEGACSNACAVDADGTSADCGDNRFCIAEGAPGSDYSCRNKLDNGELIPPRAEDGAVSGICVLPGENVATHVTATIFCASGVCNTTDNRCGLADGDTCSQATGAAQCRSGRCGNDDKCGLTAGESCQPGQCRDGVECIEGICGGPQNECNVDTDCVPGAICGATKVCEPGCRNGSPCPNGTVCNSNDDTIGQCVPASSSSSGGSSSSGNGSSSSSSGSGEPGNGSSSSSSSGEPGEQPGDGESGGGCSTHGSNDTGSLTTLLLGLGMAVGATRRRRQR